MRLYSYVANLYLSPLQHGLQSGHVISRMYADLLRARRRGDDVTAQQTAYDNWALDGETIIICAALNSGGVEDAFEKANYFGSYLGLPATIFNEDEVSLNGATTACGIVVPDFFYEAKKVDPLDQQEFPAYEFTRISASGNFEIEHKIYDANSIESQFITFLKSYRLA